MGGNKQENRERKTSSLSRYAMDDPFLPEGPAGVIIGLERGTMSNMRSQRRGPPYVRLGGGRVIRYRLSELLAWAEKYRVDPEADR